MIDPWVPETAAPTVLLLSRAVVAVPAATPTTVLGVSALAVSATPSVVLESAPLLRSTPVMTLPVAVVVVPSVTESVSALAVGLVSVMRTVRVPLAVWLAESVTVMEMASETSPALWLWLVPVGS